MVLTRRAYKDISRWLPNEVILEIIDGLTVGDWLSLCGVSKLFHGLCIPFVYRSVKLETWATILSFCSVIVGNPAHAPLVRSFVVSRPTDLWTQYFEEELDALLPEALIIMVNLNHFSICESVWENNTNFLRHYTFPLLVSCYIHSTFKLGCPDMISSFLNRHPTLKVVRISTSFLFRPSVLTPSITLPNITYYEGPSGVVPLLHSGARGLKETRLTWHNGANPPPGHVKQVVLALKEMTNAEIPFHCCNLLIDYSWNEILEFMSRNIPQMKILRMKFAMDGDDLLSTEMIHHTTNSLRRFTNLAYLAMEYTMGTMHNRFDEDDRVTVEAWGKACPTLEACCLNNYAWRKVNGTWEPIPLADFRKLAAILQC